jgi:diacylglycerol kinase family enzyme
MLETGKHPARVTKKQTSDVLIAANPHAGAADGGARVEELRKALDSLGFQVEVVPDRVEAVAKAAQLHRSGTLRALVAAGGDGTAADLLNRTEPGFPLALLPLGTENLLARCLQVPRAPGEVGNLIASGHTIQVDAASANGRLFLLMAGCGFDADVVNRLHAARQGHITQFSYAKPIWDSIRNYRYPEFRVTYRLSLAEDTTPVEHSVVARWAFVSNLPLYGGGLSLSPDACGTDGLLDLCLFQGQSFWAGVRYVASIICRTHRRMSDCVTARATRVVIESDEPVPYQLDGDPGGMLPLIIDILPRRLTIIAPPQGLRRDRPKRDSAPQFSVGRLG